MGGTTLKSLSTQEMLDISDRCLVKRRADFDKISETHGAMQLLEKMHRKLKVVSEQSPEQAEELHDMTMQLGQVDLEHDRLVRGIYHVLVGIGELIDDAEFARESSALRDRLFPAGLNTTLLRYEEQIRAAKTAQSGITRADQELLARIDIPNSQGTLLDMVSRWWSVSSSMEELWLKRQNLRQSQEGVTAQTTSTADLIRARHQWIGAMRVLAAAVQASSLEQTQKRDLLPEMALL